MAITLSCSCGRTFQVGDEGAGKRVRCPSCGSVLRVPAAGGAGTRCPNCNAMLMPGSILCTVCGYHLRMGKTVVGDFGEKRRFPIRTLASLALLAGLVIAAVWVWRSGLLGKLAESRRRTEAEKTPAGGKTEEPRRARHLTVRDSSPPCVISRDLVVEKGQILAFEPGSALLAADGAAVVLAGGRTFIRGEAERPVTVAAPFRVEGSASLSGRGVLFAEEVSVSTSGRVDLASATFLKQVRLAPNPPLRGRSVWSFKKCEFRDPGTSMVLEGPAGVGRFELSAVGSNIAGRVTGDLTSGGRADLSGNFWRLGAGPATSALVRTGVVDLGAEEAQSLAGVGVGPDPATLLRRAGGALSGRGRLLSGRALGGFEFVYPQGWSRAGETMVLAGGEYQGARVKVERIRARSLDEVRAEVRKSVGGAGVENVSESAERSLFWADGGAFVLEFGFEISGESWRRLIAVLPVKNGAFVLHLTCKPGDVSSLKPIFKAMAATFRPAR